jgi:transcriptional regulator GlxA family with amidase domain
MTVGIIVFDGADAIDFVGAYEVWRQAAGLIEGIEVGLYTISGSEEIVAGHGLRVRTDGRLPQTLDLLIVPGGGWGSRASHGVRAEIERSRLPETIEAYHAAGTRIAAVCTGVMAVAAAGILGSRPATTHYGAIEELRATGACIVHARVVDDGDIVTCGGVTSALDLALWLVEDEFGAELSDCVADSIEYVRDPRVWRTPDAAGIGSAYCGG